MPAYQHPSPGPQIDEPLPLGLLDWETSPSSDLEPVSSGIAGSAADAAAGAAAAWPHYTDDPLLDDLTEEEKSHISPTINPDAIDVPGSIPKYY